MPERDAMGRFLPGNRASPGKVKTTPEFRARARAYSEEALDRLAAIMRDPEARTADVIRACEILIERAYGRVAQAEDETAREIVVTMQAAGPAEWSE